LPLSDEAATIAGMELDSNPTTTVPKDQAQPNWAEIGLWLSVLVSVLIGWALWNGVFSEAWTNYLDPKNVDPVPKTEALRNLTWSMGTIGAVFAGFIGLVMAGFRTVALHRQANTAQRESDLNAQKHQSEAFATAIEQLGNTNFAVRLGAVYALEALAKSALELHGPIFETLCAYVRNKAPAPKDDQVTKKPNVVVQAMLTVIGRRDPAHDPEEFRLDLRKTDLRKCDLRKGHFENALLTATHLAGADLKEIHLEGAHLGGANLKGAKLQKAHLEGANLGGAQLNGASLWCAHLEGADLVGAKLEDAHLWKARLEDANLYGAYLEGASLSNVSFNGQTNVQNADLLGARNIPATSPRDFRVTVAGADDAHWPDDDDPNAWDDEYPVDAD